MAEIGAIIQERYKILELIGKGGMSRVYLAMDQNLKNKQWAVKEIQKKPFDKNNEVLIQSAMTEANMIKKLDHPSLPRIVDIIDKKEALYVVMDYIEGEALNEVLNKYGAQPQDTVIQWAKELCLVLDYLHTQDPPIIYRDMKPANVMLQPNGNVKLIDFGIAREYKEENLADTVSLGTKGYAAPEQFGGKGQTDARTDVYCLGVTLYHLLTGQNPCEPPYEIYPIRYWNPQLSSGLESIIQKCTQMNPVDRYQSCAELLYALEHYNELDESYRKKQKKKLHKFVGTVVAAVLSLAVGIGCQVVKTQTENGNYDSNIEQAELATDIEEKITYYGNAMKIKPTETKAYLGMVEAFKADAVLSVEEDNILKQKLGEYQEKLQGASHDVELAFEVGKLYWYYSEYGKTEGTDNTITRMKSAMPYFNLVCQPENEGYENYDMAQVYSAIGKFNEEIVQQVQEAEDSGKYAEYWSSLNQLIEVITASKGEKEIVNLEVCKLIANSIESYTRKFKADGITQEDMKTLLGKTEERLKTTETTTDKTEQMKGEVTERIDIVYQTIENTFTEGQEVTE